MDDEESTCAALLHDVIEDHGDRYSFDDLAWVGPDSVIHALRLLTHESGVLYMDYVKALAKDPIARKVVRRSPAQPRIPAVKRHAAGKYELYQQAIRYLMRKPPHTGITSADFEIFFSASAESILYLRKIDAIIKANRSTQKAAGGGFLKGLRFSAL